MDILEGIRVVDLTMWAFVPSAGGVLAHWGADVIKVEGPHSPDPVRFLKGTEMPDGETWMYRHYGRGKRAIAIDLKADRGRELLYRLVRDADVFLTSYLPRTRKSLGFDVADIQALNPNIIYARGSGQGPKGPDAQRSGYDGITWWGRGTLASSAMGVAGIDFPPGMVGHGDGMSGMTLAGGICAALLKRERTGKGSVVDGSLLGTAIWFNGPSIISSGLGSDFMAAGARARHDQRHPTTNTYRSGDGRFVLLSFLGDHQDEWVDFCEHIGRPELASDPRFATSAARNENVAAGVAILDEVFSQHTLEEWRNTLATAKGAWSSVQTPAEVFDDPQTVANGFLRPVEYPGGTLRLPVPPILFDEEAGDPPPAPSFGQHTDDILAEMGLSAAEVEELRSSGVVA
jgi:crotonobetainyl-CoA:carnitine CoA-transferase CaiB-like acyl-CoA transferase